MVRKSFVSICLLALVASLPASSGVVAELEHKEMNVDPPKVRTLELTVSGPNLRMAMPPDAAMIYRGADRTMLFLDHAQKTYMSLTRDELDRLAGQMSAMMKQLEAQLAALPPEQRKMAEQMMKGHMPQGAAEALPPMTIKKTGEKAEVAGYPCTKVEVWRGDERTAEMWVTPLDRLDGAAEATDAIVGVTDFFEGLLAALRDSPLKGALPFEENPFVELQKLDGFPVRRLDYAEGKLVGESMLKSTAKRDVADDAFRPPQGYERQELPTITPN